MLSALYEDAWTRFPRLWERSRGMGTRPGVSVPADPAKTVAAPKSRTYRSNAGLRGAVVGSADVCATVGKATQNASPTTATVLTRPAQDPFAALPKSIILPQCSVAQ